MSELQLANKVRFVTATTLFDGHDASINIFRRILQASGAEVIHLGHNRSGHEIVDAAIQEDAHAIAVTSYQGGHMEFFRYLRDMLVERDAAHIRIFGGGGGTILPEEAAELAAYGVSRIYSPDDGRSLGLTGMVEDMLTRSDFPRGELDESLDLAELERSNVSMMRAKSSRLRLRRSTLYTTTQSTLPDSISAKRRISAGRSMLAPVNPPSSYLVARQTHPSCCWLLM